MSRTTFLLGRALLARRLGAKQGRVGSLTHAQARKHALEARKTRKILPSEIVLIREIKGREVRRFVPIFSN